MQTSKQDKGFFKGGLFQRFCCLDFNPSEPRFKNAVWMKGFRKNFQILLDELVVKFSFYFSSVQHGKWSIELP